MWIFFLVLLASNAFAATATINTGYGYITDNNGHIKGKYSQANHGPITIPDGYAYTEVPDQKTLDMVQIYKDPSIAAQEQLDALRQQALNDLADTQIAADPTKKNQAAGLKNQGAK